MFWTQVFSWVCACITIERSRLVEEAGRGGVRCRALGQSWAVLPAGRTWAGKCGGGGWGGGTALTGFGACIQCGSQVRAEWQEGAPAAL